MSALPKCPQCSSEYTYEDGSMVICPECAHEWSPDDAGNDATSEARVVKDAHGRVLVEFNATGPRCLFSLPEASYRVEGTYEGSMQFAIVETGSLTAQLRW